MDGPLGDGQRRAAAQMPSVKYSAQSIADLLRLHDFLAQQDPEVARRAMAVIQDALQKMAVMPERFRPVEGKMYHREAIIDFGHLFDRCWQEIRHGDFGYCDDGLRVLSHARQFEDVSRCC